MHEYDQEVRERWGDSDAYKQSSARTSKYSKEEMDAAKADQEAATELFAHAFGNGLAIDSDQAKRQFSLIARRLLTGSMTVQ